MRFRIEFKQTGTLSSGFRFFVARVLRIRSPDTDGPRLMKYPDLSRQVLPRRIP